MLAVYHLWYEGNATSTLWCAIMCAVGFDVTEQMWKVEKQEAIERAARVWERKLSWREVWDRTIRLPLHPIYTALAVSFFPRIPYTIGAILLASGLHAVSNAVASRSAYAAVVLDAVYVPAGMCYIWTVLRQ